MDAILHLVRCFEAEKITHVNSKINPAEDLETIKTEIALSDLDLIQKKLEKSKKKLLNDKEVKILEQKFKDLDSGRDLKCNNIEEEKLLSQNRIVKHKT